MAGAQDREYVRLLENLVVGASGEIKAEIADLRRQLARCDGPANLRLPTDNCAARTLVQAQLNYLLTIGRDFDPDTAGTPQPIAPATPQPPDPSDYVSLGFALLEKVRAEPPGGIVYVISENRAKLAIISHCKAMHEYQYIGAGLTDEEMAFFLSPPGNAKTKADVNVCIDEYDARVIVGNRKAAIEYCLRSNPYTTGTFAIETQIRFDLCMTTHDMLQAMCKQQGEHAQNYLMRKLPGQQRAKVTCPGVRAAPREIEAILATPVVGTMAELPPKFLAVPPAPPPHPAYPVPAPPVPIPAGTVVETTTTSQISAFPIETGDSFQVQLDRPIAVGGRMVVSAPQPIWLKGRIIGPGSQPNSVRIGLTTGLVPKGENEGGYELRSDELVFTLARTNPAPAGLSLYIPLNTKLRFTIGSSASSAAPGAGASAAAPTVRPAPVPPTASTPQAATPSAAARSEPPDPGRQLEEQRARVERQTACSQQAMKDHPQGGGELVQALVACAQAK